MSNKVKLADIVNEMDVISDEHYPYLNKKTGKVVTAVREAFDVVESDKPLSDL